MRAAFAQRRLLSGHLGSGAPKDVFAGVFPELTPEGLARSKEAAHDGPDRDVEGLGDVAVGQLHEVRQLYNRAKLGLELCERPNDGR